MTAEGGPFAQLGLPELDEVYTRLTTDQEGHEAIMAGIGMGLRELRDDDLTPEDQELLDLFDKDPIGAINFYRSLKRYGLVDAT